MRLNALTALGSTFSKPVYQMDRRGNNIIRSSGYNLITRGGLGPVEIRYILTSVSSGLCGEKRGGGGPYSQASEI